VKTLRAGVWLVLVWLAGGQLGAQTLVNLSTLATAGGATPLTSGFVVSGGSKTVLIRAIGPTLQSFGVTGVLPNPVLTVFEQNGTVVASNDRWGGTTALSTVFTQTGAFALPSGSLDSALVTTLPAGTYSAQATSATGATGLCLIEIYDVSGAGSTLSNVSTLLPLGAIAPTFGFVVSPGSGSRELLIRAVGPGLADLGVPTVLSDPNLSVVNSATMQVVAQNDDWGSSDPAGLDAAFAAAGAFALTPGSKDAALVAAFPPGNYGAIVTGNNGATGSVLVEIYDITPVGSSVVSIGASASAGSVPGTFTVSRAGDVTLPLTVAYSAAGSAVAGTDYAPLSGVVTIPAGAGSAAVSLTLYPSTNSNPSVAVTLSLMAGSGYSLAANSAATVTFAPLPATLYTAVLRPTGTASTSTASGTAIILANAATGLALVTVSYSNLSSPEVISHLELGTPGQNAAYVLSLGSSQVAGQVWTFAPTGPYSAANLVSALQSGQIFVEVDTADYPAGELTGGFIQSTGSQTFTAPAAPPALPASALGANTDSTNAARLLTQATFGPTAADIATVTNEGVSAWITAQLAQPATSHLAAVRADATAFPNPQSPTSNSYFFTESVNQQAAWWQIALTAPDQLRQRVAFALSEIMVVSEQNAGLTHAQEGMAKYYDTLAADAFGNFRTLLQDVTLSPVMGTYLSSLHNEAGNAALGTSADENYAREVQQLFTVGLVQLQPDGTLQLDNTGQPIPTYDQTEVTSTARVFTGWSFASSTNNFFANPVPGTAYSEELPDSSPWLNPMQAFNSYHDTTAKTILGGVAIPAGGTAQSDLQIELDTLFNYPSTGPFIAQQLIQRLVTSNPSPGYVYRVAQVFANNGSGVRGDLGAVVRAILSDYEARSASVTADAGYGKVKEPLLRISGLLRALNAASQNGRYIEYVAGGTGNSSYLASPMGTFEEQALDAGTVFNFFAPGFVSPGPLAAAGLLAPEFQITDANSSIATPNALYTFIFDRQAPQPSNLLLLDLSALTPLASNPSALLDQLSLLFCNNAMSSATRARITTALASLGSGDTAVQLVESALYLTLTAAESAVQR
jgi:uncharacterized protein (DUF1800 family)